MPTLFFPVSSFVGMLFWPGTQLVSIAIMLMAIQRYCAHVPGDIDWQLAAVGSFGAFFIIRIAFILVRRILR